MPVREVADGSNSDTPWWREKLALVQEEERARILRFRFVLDRKRALAGRLLMRRRIAGAFGVDAASIELQRSALGKPLLAAPAPGRFSFNLSHHGDWVVLLSHPERVVGVDVVKVEMPRGTATVASFFHTMRASFTPEEWAAIRGGRPDEAQGMTELRRFYQHWSLKEAYIKAIGQGIGFGLQRVSFHLDEATGLAVLYVDGKLDERFAFAVQSLDDTHFVGSAIETDGHDQQDAEAQGESLRMTRIDDI